jgi:hypothetical protein
VGRIQGEGGDLQRPAVDETYRQPLRTKARIQNLSPIVESIKTRFLFRFFFIKFYFALFFLSFLGERKIIE